jgi:hypothetical protein
MLRQFVTGACFVALATGCFATGHSHRDNVSNAALTGACLATVLPPCEMVTPPDVRAAKKEAKAAATRAEAQRSADEATQDAVQRSSCLTDSGPRLPLSPGQCASITAQH